MHLASQSAHRSFALHCFAFRYCCYYTAYCGSIMSFAIAYLVSPTIRSYSLSAIIAFLCLATGYWLAAWCASLLYVFFLLAY